jgi:nucleotide-binding universal stress UspA family protein
MVRRSILCPIDFSEPSRGALRFAATIAERFHAGLTVATVDDPQLSGVAGTVDVRGTYETRAREELERFVKETFLCRRPVLAELHLEVAAGRPADEIQRMAQTQGADLIVMSSHGRTGISKVVFGSTTERVLHHTAVPVLVTPAADPGPIPLDDPRHRFGGVLAPVDLTPFSHRQIAVAHGIAQALQSRLTIAHIIEPQLALEQSEAAHWCAGDQRKRRAFDALKAFVLPSAPVLRPNLVIAVGNPAEEIARLARERHVGVIVMGLHSSQVFGPRVGSVTYRVLGQTRVAVLALPPCAKDLPRKATFEAGAREAVLVG